MYKPDTTETVYLKTGELFWGDKNYRIMTTLGSCISICLWHPEKQIGGISHFMMPGKRQIRRPGKLNPKFCDDVIWLFLDLIKKAHTRPEDYIVKVFGGTMFNIYPGPIPENLQVGKKNIEEARKRLKQFGFNVTIENTGGEKPRTIIFDLWDGTVWLRKYKKLNLPDGENK